MTTPITAKPCQYREPCTEPAVRGERFCPCHRRAMLREMEASGYLTPLPDKGEWRRRSARENVKETKYGADA